MDSFEKVFRWWASALAALLICATSARATEAPPGPMVSTSDVKLTLHGSGPQPGIAILDGPAQLSLTNRAEEQLPPTVEINGTAVPVKWEHKSALDSANARHVVFVYESPSPH